MIFANTRNGNLCSYCHAFWMVVQNHMYVPFHPDLAENTSSFLLEKHLTLQQIMIECWLTGQKNYMQSFVRIQQVSFRWRNYWFVQTWLVNRVAHELPRALGSVSLKAHTYPDASPSMVKGLDPSLTRYQTSSTTWCSCGHVVFGYCTLGFSTWRLRSDNQHWLYCFALLIMSSACVWTCTLRNLSIERCESVSSLPKAKSMTLVFDKDSRTDQWYHLITLSGPGCKPLWGTHRYQIRHIGKTWYKNLGPYLTLGILCSGWPWTRAAMEAAWKTWDCYYYTLCNIGIKYALFQQYYGAKGPNNRKVGQNKVQYRRAHNTLYHLLLQWQTRRRGWQFLQALVQQSMDRVPFRRLRSW